MLVTKAVFFVLARRDILQSRFALRGLRSWGGTSAAKPSTGRFFSPLLRAHVLQGSSFADELHKELTDLGIKVWYDAISIKWGDSLRSKIDDGLRKSKDYIKKDWTNYELDALFQREMTGGKTILPIWHNITKEEVEDFSLTLSGRLALNTGTMTPAEIATELKNILGL